MVAILMENPKHGRHHFYSPQEAEAAKKHGWVVVEPQQEMTDVSFVAFRKSVAQATADAWTEEKAKAPRAAKKK